MAEFRESSREPGVQPARRAEIVSLIGLFLQLSVFAVVLLVALHNKSCATFTTAFFVLGGVIVWLATLLVYHQEKLVQLEALEAEQIDRDREAVGAEALFDDGRSGLDTLLVARGRLQWMRRWLVPVVGGMTAVYLIAMGAFLWKWYLTDPVGSDEWPAIQNASVSLAFMVGVAFLSFLFSRYAVGMARIGAMWQMMRSGGGYLTGNALACAVTAAMLGFAAYGKSVPEMVLAKAIPIVMAVIGLEIIVNLVLDVYRPRKAGEVARPAFDSRLLGLISEPGGIARTIADSVNYQFGFEVSKTWFYQLLERWVLVLVGTAFLVLFLMTCIVIVEPGEQAVVERFGRPIGLTDKSIEPLNPGLNLKLPWPIDCVTRYRVDFVHTIRLGFGPWTRKNPPKVEGVPRLILWTNPVHGPGEELDFVLPVRPEVQLAGAATRPVTTRRATGEGPRTPAVNLLRLSLPVMYRVRDLYQYAFHYADPQTLIESSAYGELVKYVANKDLDELLAVRRRQIGEDLQRLVQERCDDLGVGVEIVFIGLEDIHPPQRAAKEFEAYLNAKYEMGAAIAKAEGRANKILSEVAGNRRLAERLGESIRRAQRLQSEGASDAELAKAAAEIERRFGGAPGEPDRISGEAAEVDALARADRWTRENRARARASSFKKELIAYRVAPRLYRMRRIIEVLTNGLRNADKYVIARDGDVYVRYDDVKREQVQLEEIDYNVPPD